MGVKRIVAVAFDKETDPQLAGLVDDIVWIKVGQLSKLIASFQERGITQCVMLGQIAPRSLFDIRPDLRGLTALLKLKEKNAHTVFGALIDELRKDGIEVLEALPWLRPIMPGKGFHLGPELNAQQREDIAFGLRIAKEISRLEIGQSVVVKGGTVLAVEGFEGTDNCLRRGGELSGNDRGAIAVKVARDKHDTRFDVPCVGSKTLQVCAEAGISVLAFEPGMTLLLDREEVEALCKKHRITVTTV